MAQDLHIHSFCSSEKWLRLFSSVHSFIIKLREIPANFLLIELKEFFCYIVEIKTTYLVEIKVLVRKSDVMNYYCPYPCCYRFGKIRATVRVLIAYFISRLREVQGNPKELYCSKFISILKPITNNLSCSFSGSANCILEIESAT